MAADSHTFERRLRHWIGAVCSSSGGGIASGRCLSAWGAFPVGWPEPGRVVARGQPRAEATAVLPERLSARTRSMDLGCGDSLVSGGAGGSSGAGEEFGWLALNVEHALACSY